MRHFCSAPVHRNRSSDLNWFPLRDRLERALVSGSRLWCGRGDHAGSVCAPRRIVEVVSSPPQTVPAKAAQIERLFLSTRGSLNTFLTICFLEVLSARHTSWRARDGGPVHAPPGIDFAPISLTKLRSLARRGNGV